MSLNVVVDQHTLEQWRTLALTFSDNNIYQSWQFGVRRAAEMKAEVSRLVVWRGNTVLGMAQARIKRIPWTRAGIAYVYRGPLWRRRGSSPCNLQAVLEAIRTEYVLRRGLEVRMVPNLPTCFADQNILDSFEKTGYLPDPSVDVYRTFLLDLSRPLHELRRGLVQKWRNCLNQSKKRGLTVQAGNDDAAMAKFEELYDAMWTQKKFETGVTVGSFRALQRELPDQDKQTVLLAFSNGQPVAGHVSSLLGDTGIYLLGASNDEGRKTKASYLLQWRTIEMAKEAGAQWYDLGGIDPEKGPGVYHFKAGLNGLDCTFVGQFRAQANGLGKSLLPLAERAYTVLQSLRRACRRRQRQHRSPDQEAG